MTPEMVTSLISGGGTLALAVLVWLQQRDMSTTLVEMRVLLGQLVTYTRVARESGPIASLPALPSTPEVPTHAKE